MSLLPYSAAPPSRKTVYSPADYVVAPSSAGVKADYYTDGTDDEVQINAALTAAAALTDGGVVQLVNGDYTLGASIIPPSGIWLRGQGMFTTRIKVKTNAQFALINNRSLHTTAGSPWQKAILSDFELDGSNILNSTSWKGIDSQFLNDCKIFRLYVHDTTATGIGADDFYGTTISECIVKNCGYANKHTITAASWSANVFTFTTADPHGYSIGNVIIVSGMIPFGYNNKYVVTSIVDTTNFTVDISNNAGNLTIPVNPGTATTFGLTSDSIIGHNGIGIASGGNTHEANIITNNICIGNQNNNFLIEDDYVGTDANASYIFSNNISISAGQCGFRNTGTKNTQFNNNYDYGSPYGAYIIAVNPQATITAASWSGGVASYTTSTAHSYSIGTKVSISGMTPSGYNGYYSVASIPTSTTFTVAITNDPGAATVFGVSSYTAHDVGGTTLINNIFSDNVLYCVRVDTHSNGVYMRGNIMKNCLNYGIQVTSGNGAITNNTILNNGLEAIYILTGSSGYQPLDNLDVSGNTILNNSQQTANHDGIQVLSSVNTPISNLTINGNHCFDNQTTPTQRYGCLVKSGGNNQNILITGNNFIGNATGPLFIQDTSNTIWASNNAGSNPIGKNNLGNITGSTTFDCSTGNYFLGTLTGNVTAVFPSTLVPIGSSMTLVLTQDGTGSRTFTLPANATAAQGGLTLSTAASAIDTVIFAWDGSKWRETSRDMSTAQAVAPLLDINNNKVISSVATASAVSYLEVTNAASGGTITLAATASSGTPNFVLKGSGTFALRPTTNSTNAIRLQDSAGSGNVLVADTTNIRVGINTTTPADTLSVNGSLNLITAGNKLKITTGTNASAGTGTLVGGTVTISTTAVTASSLIFLTDTASSLTNVGVLSVTAKSAGTSFTVTSTNVLDTGTFNWLIIN